MKNFRIKTHLDYSIPRCDAVQIPNIQTATAEEELKTINEGHIFSTKKQNCIKPLDSSRKHTSCFHAPRKCIHTTYIPCLCSYVMDGGTKTIIQQCMAYKSTGTDYPSVKHTNHSVYIQYVVSKKNGMSLGIITAKIGTLNCISTVHLCTSSQQYI